MKTSDNTPTTSLLPLTTAWLALVALTLVSPMLGDWLHGAAGLQLLVAAIVWFKGWLVTRRFIESEQAHPFIRRVLNGFILFTPLALILTALYGRQFAHWATL